MGRVRRAWVVVLATSTCILGCNKGLSRDLASRLVSDAIKKEQVLHLYAGMIYVDREQARIVGVGPSWNIVDPPGDVETALDVYDAAEATGLLAVAGKPSSSGVFGEAEYKGASRLILQVIPGTFASPFLVGTKNDGVIKVKLGEWGAECTGVFVDGAGSQAMVDHRSKFIPNPEIATAVDRLIKSPTIGERFRAVSYQGRSTLARYDDGWRVVTP